MLHSIYGNFQLQVASLRGSISSFQEQASCKPRVSSIEVPYRLCESFKLQMLLSSPLEVRQSRVYIKRVPLLMLMHVFTSYMILFRGDVEPKSMF